MITGFDLMGIASRQLRPFHRMTMDQRHAFLERMESDRVGFRRDLTVGLKALISLAYFSTPEVAAAINAEPSEIVATSA